MDPVGRIWDLVVLLVQLMFRDVPVEIVWAKMVLIPKGKGVGRGYRLIGLLEVLWKICSVVVNCRIKRSAVLHNALHGFRTGRGTGTETLEAKLSQKLTGPTYESLFQISLDVLKAYNLLNQEQCLELLRVYGLGTNLSWLLEKYWWR